MCTTSRPPASSRLNQPTSIDCDAFAKAACRDAFRTRDLRLARAADFVDRSPNQQPKRLGEIVEEITAAAARRAIRYWQKEATLAITQAEREEALSIAGKIARAAGLDWPEDWGEAA